MKRIHALWNRFVGGDNTALGELYAELFEPLVFSAFHYVKNMDVARDIVGDLFVTVLETDLETRRNKWSSIASSKAYLTTAVRNKSIDYLRKKKYETAMPTELGEPIQHELFSDEYLNLLTEKEVALFRMHLDGYKNEEIAQNLTLSEKTVRNKLSISRRKMIAYFKFMLILWS
jgi:RNA polymerase sigma factor (sigma-70 family)